MSKERGSIITFESLQTTVCWSSNICLNIHLLPLNFSFIRVLLIIRNPNSLIWELDSQSEQIVAANQSSQCHIPEEKCWCGSCFFPTAAAITISHSLTSMTTNPDIFPLCSAAWTSLCLSILLSHTNLYLLWGYCAFPHSLDLTRTWS